MVCRSEHALPPSLVCCCRTESPRSSLLKHMGLPQSSLWHLPPVCMGSTSVLLGTWTHRVPSPPPRRGVCLEQCEEGVSLPLACVHISCSDSIVLGRGIPGDWGSGWGSGLVGSQGQPKVRGGGGVVSVVERSLVVNCSHVHLQQCPQSHSMPVTSAGQHYLLHKL